MLSFIVSREDAARIAEIVKRASKVLKDHDVLYDRLDMTMDLTATHASGCPLDLSKLFAFPSEDLIHDVLGIRKHLDRRTGRLKDHFLPRSAR